MHTNSLIYSECTFTMGFIKNMYSKYLIISYTAMYVQSVIYMMTFIQKLVIKKNLNTCNKYVCNKISKHSPSNNTFLHRVVLFSMALKSIWYVNVILGKNRRLSLNIRSSGETASLTAIFILYFPKCIWYTIENNIILPQYDYSI